MSYNFNQDYIYKYNQPYYIGQTLYSDESEKLKKSLLLYNLTHSIIDNLSYNPSKKVVITPQNQFDPNVFNVPLVIDKKLLHDKGYNLVVSTTEDIDTLSPILPNVLLVGNYNNYDTPGIKSVIVKYYNHKFIKSWINKKLKYLLKYFVVTNGVVNYIKNDKFDDYEKNTKEDIQLKINFIDRVIDSIDIQNILNKFIKKYNLNWSMLNKKIYKKSIRQYIGKKAEEIIIKNMKK
jgi:hypothetical protein